MTLRFIVVALFQSGERRLNNHGIGRGIFPPSGTKDRDLEQRWQQLSQRELDVLSAFFREGISTDEDVSLYLGIAVGTVRKHIERVFDKLGTNNRVQLGGLAVYFGLIGGKSERD